MQSTPNHIRIWKWTDAPQELKDLSTNGGDEDWVALLPPHIADEWIGWMDTGSSFGCCCVDEYSHPELPGYSVRIGCHAVLITGEERVRFISWLAQNSIY